jgi:protein-S-isoprenylcysteine O-methyltransferase Ste14
VGGAVILPVLGMVVLSRPRVREGTWPNVLLDVIGWFLFLSAAVLRFWAMLYIGGRKGRTVVREGPYSVCRNPLYIGNFLLLLSAGAYLKSGVFALAVLPVAVFYGAATIPAEEERLRAQLGEAYGEYCREVHRFRPRLTHYRSAATLEVSVEQLRTECLRALWWIWWPAAGAVLAHLRIQDWWPDLFRVW